MQRAKYSQVDLAGEDQSQKSKDVKTIIWNLSQHGIDAKIDIKTNGTEERRRKHIFTRTIT